MSNRGFERSVMATVVVAAFAMIATSWTWFEVQLANERKQELIVAIAKLELKAEAQAKQNKKAGICP